MIRHSVVQGSTEWQQLRCGKPTASEFWRILTPKGKLSETSREYMHRLCAERVLGYALETVSTAAMEAGRIREPEAANWYALHRDVDLEDAGICFTDDDRIGASPDRFVSGGGLIEIKCPMPQTHIGYLMNGVGIQAAYKAQIQGQLFVCEADWLDSVSYCPPLPPSLVRITRDKEYIALLEKALREFCDRLDEMEQKVLAMGG